MPIRRYFALATLLLFAAAVPALSGCSDDGKDSTGPNTGLFASWNATSVTAGGNDFIAMGMTLGLTLSANGDYQLDVTGDLIDICTPLSDCTVNGSFTAGGKKVTLDPGTTDEVTLNYTLVGTTLTFTGDINGTPATFVFQKV